MRILYLDIDSLRADHLGCYGYHRNTSPTIDQLAKEGVRFDNYYCSDAPCLPSRTAMMTGRFGIHSGVVGHGGTAADLRIEGPNRGFRTTVSIESLPNVFRGAGMKTALVSPFAERHTALQFYSGFNEIFNTGKGGIESAEEITPTVLKWIQDNAKQENWFLHVNYWDPHTPYRTPAEFGNPFEKEPLPKWLTPEILEKHQHMVGPHGARDTYMFDNRTLPKFPRYMGEIRNMTDLHRFIDGYDCGVRYMDDHVHQIISSLDKLGVLDDTMIILSADHAENLGEFGIYGEHGTADYATCRIPLIIRAPGGPKEKVDSNLHYNIDLMPTLCEYLKGQPKPGWDGQSFSSALGIGKENDREYLVISQCAHVCQRSVRFGDWYYIRSYHDGFHLFPDEMLFNIKDDPHEQKDLAPAHKEICQQAVYYLNQWHDHMMSTMSYDNDPLWTVMKEGGPFHAKGALKQYCEFLEKSDRAWAVPELKKKYPKEFL